MTIGDYLLIPLVLFTLALYPLLRKGISLFNVYVNHCVQQSKREKKEENTRLQTWVNLKLLAYERIVLLIERLKPDSLIPRTLSPEVSCQEYHLRLIQEIRKEFEYNLSQQLYLSENTWELAVNFKDQVITLVNTAAAECPADAKAGQLAREILERYISANLQTNQLLKIIKQESENEINHPFYKG